jgi:O-antigen/teichoic acid export membrane protein
MDIIVETREVPNKSIFQRVSSNFGWSVVSEGITKGVFFVTNIYLARTLGVSSFGIFTLAQTITWYFWLAVDLGTNMYGIREIAKNKENTEEIINPLLTLRITAGFIVFSLYTISLLLLNIPAVQKLTFIGCGFYLLTYSLYTDWILKGLERFKYIAFGSSISSLFFLIATISVVKGNNDLVVASFIWSFSYFLGGVSLLFFLYRKLGVKYKPSFELGVWFSHIKESIYFTVSGGLMVIYQYLPILLLSIFFTAFEVGLFSAPYRVVITLCSAGFLLPMAFYPVFAELYHKDKNKFMKTHKKFQVIMLVLGIPIGVGGTMFADEIVNFLFGSQYMESATIFKILVWLVPLYFFRYTYGSVLLATGFQKWQVLSTSLGGLTLILFSYVLMSQSPLVGVSIAVILAEIALILGLFGIGRITFKVDKDR